MSLTQIINKPSLYINDMGISYLTTTTILMNSGLVRNSDNSYDITVASPITMNLALNGANGLDVGSLAASSWYSVWAIGDSRNYNAGAYIATLGTHSVPTMPDGYDVLERVAWFKTDGSSHVIKFAQYGIRGERVYIWDEGVQVFNGSSPGLSFTALSLAGSVPPSVQLVKFILSLASNSASNVMRIRPTGTASANHLYVQNSAATNAASHALESNCSALQSIDYESTSTSDTLQIWVNGFTDFI